MSLETFVKCKQQHMDLDELESIRPDFKKFLKCDLQCFSEGENGYFIKAFLGGTLVGFIFFFKLSNSPNCRISYIYVKEDCRGTGIAKRLVTKVVDECILQGWTGIALETDPRYRSTQRRVLNAIKHQEHRINFTIAGLMTS